MGRKTSSPDIGWYNWLSYDFQGVKLYVCFHLTRVVRNIIQPSHFEIRWCLGQIFCISQCFIVVIIIIIIIIIILVLLFEKEKVVWGRRELLKLQCRGIVPKRFRMRFYYFKSDQFCLPCGVIPQKKKKKKNKTKLSLLFTSSPLFKEKC